MKKRTLGRMFVAAMLLVVGPVYADEPADPHAVAQILYEQGKEAAKAGQWEKAETAFAGAQDHERSPKTAGQLGRVQVERHKYVEGATNLEWFFQEDTEVPAELKDAIRPLLTLAKKNLATVKLKVDQPGAVVRMDGQLVDDNRLSWPHYLAPGTHVFEAKKDGFVTVTETKKLDAGTEAPVELKLVKVGGRVEKDKPDPRPMPTSVKAAWIVGGALAGIGLGTGIGAVVTYLPMQDAWRENGCGTNCRSQYESRQPLIEGLSTTALVSGVLGAVVVGYAIYGTLTIRKEQVGFRLAPRTNGAEIVVKW